MKTLFVFAIFLITLDSYGQSNQDVALIENAIQSLQGSDCMGTMTKNSDGTAFIQIAKGTKELSIFISKHTKNEKAKDSIEYISTWSPSGVLFVSVDYTNKLILEFKNKILKRVVLTEKKLGIELYFPVISYKRITCVIE